MDLKKVVRTLNDLAPLSLAESWDNVGLLVEPSQATTIKKILLTNDLTEAVLQETVNERANFILSYHPPIFRGLKRLTQSHWKDRIVTRCLELGIAIYSPHTAHDALFGGVNDWLAGAFGEAETSPISTSTGNASFTNEINFAVSDAEILGETLQDLENVLGKNGDVVVNHRLCVIYTSKNSLIQCLDFLSNRSSLKHGSIIVKSCAQVPKVNFGMGRVSKLKNKMSVSDVVSRLKKMTGLSHMRLAFAVGHSMDFLVKKGAVCAGSGIGVLRGINADLIITGEMSHHDVLEFTQTGTSVILLEHSNSERGYLSAVLKPKLDEIFKNSPEIIVSKVDRDPLEII